MKNSLKGNWFKIIAFGTLLGALGDHPYSYYQLTRWLTTICSAYLAFSYFENHKTVFMWLFIALAILFNPIFPFYFSKDMWQIFDVTGAVLFFVSLFIKTNKK
ncbi:MAG: DUF6804 family protein [Patescibacteria group bacterium]